MHVFEESGEVTYDIWDALIENLRKSLFVLSTGSLKFEL